MSPVTDILASNPTGIANLMRAHRLRMSRRIHIEKTNRKLVAHEYVRGHSGIKIGQCHDDKDLISTIP